LNALDELSELLSGQARAVVLAERDVNLRSCLQNTLFVLKMAEGSLASGGRGGGFGERRVVAAYAFVCSGGAWSKVFETSDTSKVESFEVPFHVSRIPIVLGDGSEAMGYGVVEPGLVKEYLARAGLS
jgi:hypothetical protein